MKKEYKAPTAVGIRLFAENDLAGNGITLASLGGGSQASTIDDNADILSNKKENPVWGGTTHKGPWGE